MEFSQKDIDRFWSYIDKKDDDECWDWNGRLDRDGYGGQIKISKKRFRPLRISLFLHTKNLQNFINKKVLACHTCHNRKCCNPKHLYWGDNFTNARDKNTDGTDANGEKSVLSKITKKQVLEIREKYAKGGISQQALGAEYGVNQTTISCIVLKKRWKLV
jgi:hypothetical protein